MRYSNISATEKIKIDQAQALKQLSMLGYKDGNRVCLRFFYPSDDPRKDKDTGKKLTCKFPDLNWEQMERLQEDGRGCYVVVNYGGHTDKEITSFRAIFYEHDDISKSDQIELWKSLSYDLPSFQVDTGGKSIHTYYLFNAPDYEADPVTEQKWRELQTDLLNHSKGDKALKNPSRVMRLAGAYHVSNPDGERHYSMSRIITISGSDFHPSTRAIDYNYTVLREMVPSANAEVEAKQFESKIGDRENTEVNSISAVSNFPLEEALTRDHRILLETGVSKGSRNCDAYSLACDLLGAAKTLQDLGVRISADPKQYFDLFTTVRCSPPLSAGEAKSVWESAMKRNDGKGSRSIESIEKSVKWWQSQQQKKQPPQEVRSETVSQQLRAPKLLESQYEVTDDAATPDFHLNKYFFKEGKGEYCVIDGAFYREAQGVWEALGDEEVEKLISDQLKKLYRIKFDKETVRKIFSFASAKNLKSTFVFNRAALAIPKAKRPDSQYLINFKNGVLNTRTNELLPHSRELYLTSQIQADYVQGQDCPKAFLRFVERCYGLNQLPLIRACIRYCVDYSLPFGWFLHLIGKSGTGKGTLTKFLRKIHGQFYKGLNEFSVLNTPEGRYQNLTGARLVALPDVIGALPKLNAFYELVDNGALSGRALYSSKAATIQWNCRFILASVDPIRFENPDSGWTRRVVPVSTIDREGEVDPNLAASLEGCEAGVLSWAMGMAREEVIAQFTTERTTSPEYLRLRDEQAIVSDSIQAFIDSCLSPSDQGEEINKYQLFGYYKAFCESTGKKPKEFNGFCRGIKSELTSKFEAARTTKSEGGKIVSIPARFINIQVVNPLLFIPKVLPGGTLATEEQAIYSCNVTRLHEGGLQQFREWNPIEKTVAVLEQSENAGELQTEALPSWVKVGGCFLNGTNTPIRIRSIERLSDEIILVDPTGSRYPLSKCRPEIIPASVRRAN